MSAYGAASPVRDRRLYSGCILRDTSKNLDIKIWRCIKVWDFIQNELLGTFIAICVAGIIIAGYVFNAIQNILI